MGKGAIKVDICPWEQRPRLLKAEAEHSSIKGVAMAHMPSAEGGQDENFPAHAKNYSGFINLLKYSTILVAIITAIVVYIIGN